MALVSKTKGSQPDHLEQPVVVRSQTRGGRLVSSVKRQWVFYTMMIPGLGSIPNSV